ncbi:Slit homolog 1 protein [Caenorhabditis elegans]|uniref:Slit homolog 1 protein n=1 Tax=Caenorhabditis elegans TaxID=6239 RepID=SLIT1_CAEEL|nr:Slit homolog 1 protein [Caenorhabditis elegans]G5EFX6.1 RecName: Full=Slit homolog 1 protein; Short=Slt-1; Flags: Precursor [Caenorhabditis elegans]CAA93668.3 Slit homolog 1 protein [Caenorhabditis elegans]|eukprot:NP_510437.2 Slit homolog 1 protein [Caenorhabditis elegans]
MLICFIFILLIPESATCPAECVCVDRTVSCVGQQLTEVPQNIPNDTIRLDLQDNEITKIGPNDFSSLMNLKALQLMDNQIVTIHNQSFSSLVFLQKLRLSRNRIRHLPDNVFQNNLKLTHLDLSENDITVVSDAQLQGPEFLEVLNLDKNHIFCLENNVISSWVSLEVLTLNGNRLTTFEEPSNARFRQLDLFNNPWNCDCRLRWMRKWLEKAEGQNKTVCATPLNLQGSSIEILQDKFMTCSGNRKRRYKKTCETAEICPLPCTCTGTTVDCRDSGLTYVPTNLPPSTTEIRLEQNQISSIPSHSFKNLKNLTRLDLSKNIITEIQPKAFLGLHNLHTLVLYGNNITDLKSDTFEGLGSLQLLLLNANQLTCIRRGTFDHVPKLSMLSLYDNDIKSISEVTFQNLTSLSTLHLAKNPLICDCNLQWLAQINLQKNIETSGARCEQPKRLRKKKFATLPPNKFKCKGSESFVSMYADSCFIDSICPTQCDCYGTTVDCNKRGLNTIPTSIPRFATQLLLSGNNISTVDLNSNIHVLENLEVLDLSNNHITFINDKSFEKLSKLRELRLNDNKLHHFSSMVLDEQSNLEILDLSGNNIQCFSSIFFNKATRIREIKVIGNDLLCDCRILPLMSWLRSNSSHSIDIPPCQQFQYSDNESDKQRCAAFPEETCSDDSNLCPPKCSCLDRVVRCSNKNLTSFPSRIPFDTTELYLDANYINEIPAHDLNRLYSLTKLDLSHNRLISLENNTFSNLTRLSTLIISYNKLRCLQPLAFNGLNALRILSLHGNDISFLPQSAFSNLTSITHIAVGSNSLYCDCNMAWFSKWIKSKFIEAGIARCEYPNTVSNQLLLTAQPYQFTCDSKVPTKLATKCDLCLNSPCKNNAICETTSSRKYTCNCTPGFYGVHCENQIDACYGSPCLNNATCKVAQAGRFNCYCNKGFEGDYCEKNIDDCVNSKCENGGKCVDLINSYRCDCPMEYEGKHCEDKLEYCTKKLNPCENNGKCIPINGSYSCMCSPGFTGNNCETNIDDCKNVECQNGGSCVDGILSYDCLCRPGYAGQYCEIPPMMDMEYQKTDACQQSACGQGECVASQNSSDFTCKCHEGFSGPSCDRQMSVGFKNPGAYLALDPLASDGTITMTLRTTSKIGILLYYGDDHFVSAELYDGRVKLVYYIGNFPASHMYSSVKVNDGLPHRISIRTSERKCFLQIDKNPVQIVENSGKSDQLITKGKEMLYIGGLPIEKSQDAKRRFHVKNSESLKGCISSITINEVPINLQQALENVNTEQSCSATVNFCAGIDCGNGKCTNNALSPKGYMCQCDSHFSGEHCDEKRIKCDKQKFRRHHIENECRSVDRIKIAECNGYCGGEQNCCTAVKKKQRKVKMICKNGTTKISTVHIIRQCQCEPTKSVLSEK